MKLPLSKISPSSFSPKVKMTKEEKDALKVSLKMFPNLTRLLVCHDFIKGEGFIVLDGNTRFEIFKEQKIKEVECKIVEEITSEKQLKRFIALFDNLKKKYNTTDLINNVNDIGEDIFKLIKLDLSKYELKDIGELPEIQEIEKETLFISLPIQLAKKIRRKFLSIQKTEKYFNGILDKMTIADYSKALIYYDNNNLYEDR
jgi:hypothetical protein